jgi:hypothetical protein
MSTDQIILPDFVIANLYGNNLVVGNDVIPKERTSITGNVKAVEVISDAPTLLAVSKPAASIPTTSFPITLVPSTEIPTTQQTSANHSTTVKPITENPKPLHLAVETPKQWFLGNNGKQITVLVKEEMVPYINDKHLQFLSTVLSACKLNIGDIALVNYKQFSFSFEELRGKSNPKFILAFDLQPKELKLPFTIPFYQVQDYAQCRFLFAPSLSKMEGSQADAKSEKTKLWNSLKTLFSL